MTAALTTTATKNKNKNNNDDDDNTTTTKRKKDKPVEIKKALVQNRVVWHCISHQSHHWRCRNYADSKKDVPWTSVPCWPAPPNNNNNRIQRRYSRTAPRTVSNTYAQVARAQPCANHVQHIERLSRASVMLRATRYEGTAQLLNLTKLKSHLFELYFIGWIIKPMKEGRKSEYPDKTPSDELQKMPHTTARRFKPQARLEPAQ